MLFEPLVEEFAFTHRTDRLVGDLVLPPWPGPHPTVVLVEGSGPGGRAPGTWPTRLAAAGLASLAYDKPGSGHSTGDWTRQTLPDRAAETTAAIQALQSRGDLITDRVALLGSSQGGWVAHLVPALCDAVAAVVTISGPGVGVLAQERHRLRHQLPAEGFTDRDVAQALTVLDDQLDRATVGEDPRAIHAAHARWRTAGWYRLLAATTPASIAFLAAIADHDPASALAGLRCPLLAIFGADDQVVPVEPSVRAIATVLRASGHQDHQIVVFPHADHGIQVPTGPGPAHTRGGHALAGQPAPGYPELVVTWLRHRLGVNEHHPGRDHTDRRPGRSTTEIVPPRGSIPTASSPGCRAPVGD